MVPASEIILATMGISSGGIGLLAGLADDAAPLGEVTAAANTHAVIHTPLVTVDTQPHDTQHHTLTRTCVYLCTHTKQDW